ncbi:MAG: DUF4863 family protein [Archangium sp.]|nr:DUF4863 family protein [Archangium sp.]
MTTKDDVVKAVQPLLAFLATSPTEAALNAQFPLSHPVMAALRRLVREGVEARTLAERDNGGVRFGRVAKALEGGFSLDVVHMRGPGLGHTHPRGEFDLCFAVDGDPRFDGRPEGWVTYPPNSWHVPTVTGGAMDILYFLPGGEIRFEEAP